MVDSPKPAGTVRAAAMKAPAATMIVSISHASPIQPESTIADKSKAVVHSLIMSDPCIDTNGNFANTRASGGVGCRDAWSFFEPEDEPSEPGSAILEGEDSTISGPVYWIAVVGLLGLIISSLTVAVTNWNRRK